MYEDKDILMIVIAQICYEIILGINKIAPT